jgi:exonuclease SbcC
MRIDRISLKSFTTFREAAALDLAGLGPGIIAIAGPNGSGKTTLLEAIPGAIYRQTPSRGSIATMAVARDAQIEVAGENGAPFSIRLDCDFQSGKQEAVIFDAAGEPLAGPKVRDFDKYVVDHFPPLDVYLASFFASQTGVGSMLRMSRSDRRSLFGRLLGLERLEQMAVAARERARAAETELTAARAALEAIRSGAEDIPALEDSLRTAKEKEAAAAEASRKAAAKLRDITAERDRLSAAVVEAERAEKAAKEAERRAEAAKESVARLEVRVRAFKPLLARAAEIRAAGAKLKELTAEMERIRAAGETVSLKSNEAQAELAARGRIVESARYAQLRALDARNDAVTQAQEARRRLAAAENSTAAVPCSGTLEDTVRAACPALVGHFRTRDEAARALDAYAKKKEELAAAVVSTTEALKKAEAVYAEASQALERVNAELGAQRQKYKEIRDRVERLKASDMTAELDRAEAETAGLQEALESARKSAANAEMEAKSLKAAVEPVDPRILEAAQGAVDAAALEREDALQEAGDVNAQIARIDEQLRTAREAHVKAQALVARLAPIEADLAEWRWLGRGLGREGVQALELDASGPRVSGLANELLADAYGPRFQIRFETQAAKADGKGVKETFDIIVVDTERGREGSGEDLSGGEKVIVGEALGLAVGLFHAQAAGVNLGTVIRDETVGALDPENGERYLAMLRAFLRVGRVHQLLYVAHNPELVQMADAVVYVDNGRIEVK